MRWNRLITSVCIFLLSWSRLLIAVVGSLLIIATFTNKFEAPLGFHLGDDYRLENQNTRLLTVVYKNIDYENITVSPKDYYIDLAEVPISKYWTIVPLFLIAGAIYFFFEQIIKLLKSIEDREFFSLSNVKRLRVIAGMLVGFSILSWSYSFLKDYFLSNLLQIEGLNKLSSGFSLSFGLFSPSLFLGLMILLVANAFEHGLRLKEEQELTI